LFLKVDWANDIKPPAEPQYIPKRVTESELNDTISYFNDSEFYDQLNAVILLGSNSGIRPEELYQLDIKDIDIEGRTLYIEILGFL